MARRYHFILLALVGTVFADLDVLSIDNYTADDALSYSVSQSPNEVKKLYEKFFPEGTSIGSLVTGNSALQRLMEKARQRSMKLEMRLLQWTDYLSNLALTEKQLASYVESYSTLESDTLPNYAEWLLSLDSGAPAGVLNNIHELVVPMFKNQGLIELVQSLISEDREADVCDLQMSAHQLILDMYNTITLTETKGYAMMQFSRMLLRIYGRGNFKQEASLTRQRYVERTEQTAAAARSALAKAKRELYRCNPPRYNSDTYAEVTRLLQGYIENEVDMNPDATCKQDCPYYSLTQNYGCYDDQFCRKQPTCEGQIIDCQFIDSDMWVCPASYGSSRRYDYIEYENGRTLGDHGYCGTTTVKVDSWRRWLFWHCSYCMCICDDASYSSHRYFSLRAAESDIARNKVVTGIRLVKLGRVFHLQIYQGTLVGKGLVESYEAVKVQTFDPNNADVIDGRDYHMLTNDRRAIDLDVLESPSGYVLTGVRFRMVGDHLHFEIRSTAFNYTTGKLYPQRSQWISNDNTAGSSWPRSQLTLSNPDIPTRGGRDLRIDSTHDQYIKFTHTDFDADAAQSTVPFIDIQPVLSSKTSRAKGATLNSGAGLYHRGASGSGGFIGVKLITYDYSHHIKAEPPPEDTKM